jgi:uncharacterized protein (TIGR03435 family)
MRPAIACSLGAALIAGGIASLPGPGLRAQAPTAPAAPITAPFGPALPPGPVGATELRFEVASIKQNKKTFAEHFMAGGTTGQGAFSGVRTLPGGRLEASYASIRPLIMRAFEVKHFQVEGGPAWLDDDRYDINATAGRDVTPAEMNAMLRSLLVERFKLRAQIVPRQMPVYALVRAHSDGRLGPNVTKTSDECVATIARQRAEGTRPTRPAPGQEPAPICGLNWVGQGETGGQRLSYGGTTIPGLMTSLQGEFDGPFEDRTGLDGQYDVVLEFHSTLMERLGQAAVGAEPSSAPTLRDAFVNQLGLKVERTTGEIPMVVIDSIERPSPD